MSSAAVVIGALRVNKISDLYDYGMLFDKPSGLVIIYMTFKISITHFNIFSSFSNCIKNFIN